MVSQPHNSKLTIELLKDFNYNKNVIMVSQPHNSEVTIDNLQVLKPTIQFINQTLTKSTLDLIVFE